MPVAADGLVTTRLLGLDPDIFIGVKDPQETVISFPIIASEYVEFLFV